MIHLTRQQQLVLITIMLLLLVGWSVKTWRLAHPPLEVEAAGQP